jgi:phospholipid-translocating ATPase
MTVSQDDRSIPLQTPEGGLVGDFVTNESDNHRYNWLTFLPITLWDYFKVFFNLYFLGMTISQFIPAFDVGYKWTFFLPLMCCLIFYLAKEFWDDYKRRMGDNITNLKKYLKLDC